MKLKNAPDRLNWLLDDWLCGRLEIASLDGHTDYKEVRQRIAAFVASFDGSSGSGFLAVDAEKGRALSDDDLDTLAEGLQLLLEQGFNNIGMMLFPMPTSAAFTIRNTGRKPPRKVGTKNGNRSTVGGVKEQRAYESAGAYMLVVQCPITIGLVMYLVGHLLLQPHMVNIRRCKRWRCRHFIVAPTVAKGAPQKFCSGSCRELFHEGK